MTGRTREHGLLTLLFLASRVGLSVAGLKFSYRFDWLFFADPADLRARLWETLVDFHLYPPGMNLLAGTLLHAGGGDRSAHVLYAAAGLVLVHSLFYLLRSLDVPNISSLLVTLVFASIPSTVYFEYSFTDTFLAGVIDALAAALLYRAALRPSAAAWAAFFSTLALLCVLRSSFHLAWFTFIFLGTLALTTRETKALVFKGALVPLLVVVLFYGKNLALFGFFGPGSHAGFVAHALTNRVLDEDKASFVSDGRISPFAALPVYASPRDYESYFAAPATTLSPLLTSLERPTVGEPNYNHLFLLDAGRIHRTDARRAVSARPFAYMREVLRTLITFFGPSTRYHPRDRSSDGPHREHRKILGTWEAAFDSMIHRLPLRPVGLYALLPLPLAWAVGRAWALLTRRRSGPRAEALLLAFCTTQIGYVTTIAAFSLSTESARYRFAIEPLIWFVTALAVRRALAAKISTASPVPTANEQ